MKLLLLKTITGDGPFFRTVAEARVYEPHEISVNRHGAVSVLAANAKWLGVKPDEMRWLDKPSVEQAFAADMERARQQVVFLAENCSNPDCPIGCPPEHADLGFPEVNCGTFKLNEKK